MPTHRKYPDNAQKQAAYRQRNKQAMQQQLTAKGLPALPVLATIPGTERWKQALEQASALLIQVQQEMQDYYDQRTEQWQQTERAEQLEQQIQVLEEVYTLLQTI